MSVPGAGQGLGPDVTAGAGPRGPVVVLDDRTRKTYRYLRASVVAMGVLLFSALLIEIVWGGGFAYGSISGFYYTAVRSVFVGALIAIGPALIAIKGRPGWEDTLLDLAGMLVPLVALVPTPTAPIAALGGCREGVKRCIPLDLEPAVVNNVTAIIVLGAVGLVFAWWSGRPLDHATRVGLRAAAGVWLVFTVVFFAFRETFLAIGHYGAAIPFFILIGVVAYLSGRDVRGRANVRMLSPGRYSATYRTIAGLMIATVVIVATWAATGWLAGFAMPRTTIFWVEAALLVLFIWFWILQTAENWDEEAGEDTGAVPAPGA